MISICVNLTLLPALILSCPRFFARTGCCGCASRAADVHGPPFLPQPLASTSAVQRVLLDSAAGAEEPSTTAAGVPLSRKDARRLASEAGRRQRGGSSCWSRLSRLSIAHGWLVVAACAALSAPCAYEALSIRTSQTQQEMMPRTAEASVAYSQMVSLFGSGSLFPFNLLIVPADGQVESEAFFERARLIVSRTLDLADAGALLNASGVMLTGGEDVPFALVQQALHADAERCALLERLLRRPVCALVRTAWSQFTDGDPSAGRNASATFVSLAPRFDPFTREGSAVIGRLRAALATARAEAGALDEVALVGGAIAMADSVDLVYSFFPSMVAITLSVVFALLGLAFRSVVVPARAVLSISVSLVLTMGCAWLVYGRGALAFLGWAPLGRQGSLAWSAPILSFPIMVGLGLDYDIFLLGARGARALAPRLALPPARAHARRGARARSLCGRPHPRVPAARLHGARFDRGGRRALGPADQRGGRDHGDRLRRAALLVVDVAQRARLLAHPVGAGRHVPRAHRARAVRHGHSQRAQLVAAQAAAARAARRLAAAAPARRPLLGARGARSTRCGAESSCAAVPCCRPVLRRALPLSVLCIRVLTTAHIRPALPLPSCVLAPQRCHPRTRPWTRLWALTSCLSSVRASPTPCEQRARCRPSTAQAVSCKATRRPQARKLVAAR